MQVQIYESIAFAISLTAFLYGLFRVAATKAPLYFKIIVNAAGCYALEELWTIVNVICGIENDMFSVRLIGIFGCFCTFLTSSIKGSKLFHDEAEKNVFAGIAALAGPAAFIAGIIIPTIYVQGERPLSHTVISFIVFLPAIIDSYFEVKCLLLPTDEMGFLKCARPVSFLILLLYAISVSYMFIKPVNVSLIIDVSSAVIMALVIVACRMGVVKWKTLI